MKTHSAFPIESKIDQFGAEVTGLTKREYFAAKAIEGMSCHLLTEYNGNISYAIDQAIKIADALIEALNKEVK